LEEEIAILQDPHKALAAGVISPELEKLQTENAKLHYQINHLKRVSMSYIRIMVFNATFNNISVISWVFF